MKCPYCDSKYTAPSVAMRNVENYGSNFFNVKCKKCKKMVRIYIERTAQLISVIKTDQKNIPDFLSYD